MTGENQNRALVSPAVRLRYLGQAGFQIERRSGASLVIDPYLTDCVEKAIGFKRMQPPVVSPEQLAPDLVLATHAHLDHLDTDALPIFSARRHTRFIGSADCEPVYLAHGLAADRFTILRAGEQTTLDGVTIRAVYADHGALAPDAVGFLLDVDGVTIYNVGDSSLQPDRLLASLGSASIDVMILPINGAFGNLNAVEACELAARIRPSMAIASHFWMFVEQGGDPAAFLAEAKRRGLNGIVMAPGERIELKRGEGKSC